MSFIQKINVILLLLLSLIIPVVTNAEPLSRDELQQLKHGKKITIINTMPKNGTHLLKKCLLLITGTQHSHHHIPWSDRYNDSVMRLALKHHFKIISIIRDPRDRIISRAEYCYAFNKNKPLLNSLENTITQLISDYGNFCKKYDPSYLPNYFFDQLADKYQDYVFNWIENYPLFYLVKFEDLVGPQGNGNKEKQIETIINIAEFIDYKISYKKATEISDQLFGGTATFNKGICGRWDKHTTKDHTRLFHQKMGRCLQRLGY